jgi:hypothetical protein
MADPRIGRVLVASLHQAIADIAPSRLEFYEYWLNSAGLRHGTIGLAPLVGVLGFLRQEEVYPLIAARAGQYTAAWTADTMWNMHRRLVGAMPGAIRARLALGAARRMVGATYGGTRLYVRKKGSDATLELRGSLFCDVREPAAGPLCGFYEAAIGRLLELLGVPVGTRIQGCRAAGASSCAIAVSLTRTGGTASIGSEMVSSR